jgi:hypothetical protein
MRRDVEHLEHPQHSHPPYVRIDVTEPWTDRVDAVLGKILHSDAGMETRKAAKGKGGKEGI